MRYQNCPKCGGQNRATDPKCFNCDAELTAAEPFVPGGGVTEDQLNNQRIARASGGVITSRNMDRSSNWMHGLRSGAIVGVITGIFWGAYLGMFGSAMLGAKGGVMVFGYAFMMELVVCTIIGIIAGALDVLCYRYDAMKIGGSVGFVIALLNFNIVQVVVGSMYYTFIGWACSHVEKLKRGQYSEI